jgi:hypothetical protein
MKTSLLRIALLATVLLPTASALAADLEPPPPELRPGYYDGSVQNLSHIFSSDGSFGLGLLGLEQRPHVHVALR